MTGYVANIERKTLDNTRFREVLFTSGRVQLVLMSLKPGEDIGLETHDHVDQFFRVEKGRGKAILDGVEHPIADGSVVVIPSGTRHNIVNVSTSDDLKLYTLYAPPQHPDRTVHATKAEAEAAEAASP